MLAISARKTGESHQFPISWMIFGPFFLIFSQKEVKILKFVSMSAVVPYRNYVQYDERMCSMNRYLFSTSDDAQYKSDTSSVQVKIYGTSK